MFHKFFRSPYWTQVFLVALFAFTLHVFMTSLGTNIVMRFYCLGGQNFLQGIDPYKSTEQYGHSDSFKYSPQFALLAGGVARMLPPETCDMQSQVTTQGFLVFAKSPGKPPKLYVSSKPLIVVGLWTLVGAAAFALGLCRWCDLSTKAPFFIVFAFLASISDLVLSTSAYQINALTIGLMLLGVADFRDGRYYSSGAYLVLAANLKIYPVIFLVALLFRFRRQYLIGALACCAFFFILPAFWVGWTHNLNAHISWVKTVLQVSADVRILDLVASFERAGLPWLGVFLDKVVFAVSLIVFFGYAAVSRCMDWRPWIAFGVAATLLVSPRSEIYTYVLLAPAYLYMFHWCLESEAGFIKKYGAIIITTLAVACASCWIFNPAGYSQQPSEIVRVLSSLGFWIFTGTALGLSLYARCKEWLASRQPANPA